MRAAVPFGFLVLLAAPGAASAKTDSQLWLGATASGKIAGPVEASLDLATRYGDAAGGLVQQRVAASLGYRIAPRLLLSGGYVYAPDFSHGRRSDREQRLREQVSATLGAFAGGTLTGYVRAEQRWRDTGHDTGWRVRGQVKWSRPFRRGGGTALVLSHESFLNLDSTDWGQRAGYDRMRNFIGIATPLCPRVRIEGGYLDQHLFVRDGVDESDHIASLALSFAF